MTADADLDGASVVLVCDGTTWTTQGVKVSNDTAACDASKDGTIRYNSGGTPQWAYCDGGATTWRPFEHAADESCFLAWEERESNRLWEGIATSDDGQNVVAVVESGRPYTSTDGGVTWTQRDSANRVWQEVASSSNGQNLVGVVYGGRPYTSTNAGVTWTQRDSANRNWVDVASSTNGVNLVGVVTGGRPYTSTDSGATWTQRDSANRTWNAVASSADGTRLVGVVGAFDPAATGQIYTSTDSGATWTARAGAGTRWWSDVAMSADGMTIAATVGTGEGGPGQIYISTDGGATWNARAHDQIWSRISMSADGTRLVAFVWGGSPWVSDDGGLTWEARGAVQDWWASAMTPDGTKLFSAETSGRIYITDCTALPDCADDMTGECLLQSTRADGDPEFLAANIADGVNVLGITGTMTGGGAGGPDDCPNIGDQCADTSIFAGYHPTMGQGGSEWLFIHPQNQDVVLWATSPGDDPGSLDYHDGRANQQWIVANRTIAQYPAFAECNTLNTSSALGHNDWYVPGQVEMAHLWSAKTAINGGAGDDLSDNYYWSSTQDNAGVGYEEMAWHVFTGSGWTDTRHKGEYGETRCMRRETATAASVGCPSGGAEVGGHCWYLGWPGQSCAEVCTYRGLSYSDATRDYAGSSGSLGNCTAVFEALLATSPAPADDSCGGGYGCANTEGWDNRCASPATTDAASGGAITRACACD